jgi:phosphoserine phosphatase
MRIVTSYPAPFSMADYEPFRPVIDDQFGLSIVENCTDRDHQHAKKLAKLAFKRGDTAGYCSIPKVQAVFFDMDATVIKEESIVVLGEAVGKSDHIREVTERAMRGEIEFRDALEHRVRLLKGIENSTLDELGHSLELNPGIAEFVAFCREIKVPTFLISGGFMQLAKGVSERVGFTEYFANFLEEGKDGCLTGRVTDPVVDAEMKRTWVLEKCAQYQFKTQDVAAVGDGANDILMMNAVGMGVGYCPKDILKPHVQALNTHGDHRMLAPLLFGRDITAKRNTY